jgi:hypothetical protein
VGRSAALVLAAIVGLAGRAAASEPAFLGWTAQGAAVARVPNPCTQCDGDPGDDLLVSDGAGRALWLSVGLPQLLTELTPAAATRAPGLDGKPVAIELRPIDTPDPRTTNRETGGALEVIATRDGAEVASTVVARMDEMEDMVKGPKVVGVYPSPDGRRLAVLVGFVSGHGDTRGPMHALAVLGPGAAVPAATWARADIVDVRHGRLPDSDRVLGWAAGVAAVVRSTHCSVLAGWTQCDTQLRLDDGAHSGVAFASSYTWSGTPRLDEATASGLIRGEELALSLLPPLDARRFEGRAPAVRAEIDAAGGKVTLTARGRALATPVSTESNAGVRAARVRKVVPSPDGRRAVVVFDWLYGSGNEKVWRIEAMTVRL